RYVYELLGALVQNLESHRLFMRESACLEHELNLASADDVTLHRRDDTVASLQRSAVHQVIPAQRGLLSEVCCLQNAQHDEFHDAQRSYPGAYPATRKVVLHKFVGFLTELVGGLGNVGRAHGTAAARRKTVLSELAQPTNLSDQPGQIIERANRPVGCGRV